MEPTPDTEPLSALALGAHTVISDDDRRKVIERLMSIIRHPKARFRSITAAARALALYQKVNLDAIRVASSCEMADVEERLEEVERVLIDQQGAHQ
jgi:hypothetical protein